MRWSHNGSFLFCIINCCLANITYFFFHKHLIFFSFVLKLRTSVSSLLDRTLGFFEMGHLSFTSEDFFPELRHSNVYNLIFSVRVIFVATHCIKLIIAVCFSSTLLAFIFSLHKLLVCVFASLRIVQHVLWSRRTKTKAHS